MKRLETAQDNYPPRPVIYQRVGRGLDPNNLTYSMEPWGKLTKQSAVQFRDNRLHGPSFFPFRKPVPPERRAEVLADYRRHMRRLNAFERKCSEIDERHGYPAAKQRMAEARDRFYRCREQIEAALKREGIVDPLDILWGSYPS